MKRFAFVPALLLASALAGLGDPAAAKVAQVSQNGFVVRHMAQVSASPEEAWAVLLKPSVWWDSEHTWSGDAANLSIDARAGGCFCEILPNATSPKASPRGSVEHMRVIYVERPRALRMVGSLGPLQSDAAVATLTFQLKPDDKGGTQVLVEYVVGGYTRTAFDKLAPAVDAMLGEQVQRLAGKLGGAFAAAFPLDTGRGEGLASQPEPDAAAGPIGHPALVVPERIEAEPVDGGVVPLSDMPPSSDGTIVGR